jgi:ornithine cyclodeaminase/alanine dehydrogenase
VKAFDIFPQVAEIFAQEMTEVSQAEIETVRDPKEAVIGLDLVVTSGPILKNPVPVIEVDWLAKGAFASPVDFDSYWSGEALRQADKLATDDTKQMEYYRKEGYFKDTPQPYADLGEIIAGKKPGREKADERTICINLGLALDDMATAILIYKKAQESKIGMQLPL